MRCLCPRPRLRGDGCASACRPDGVSDWPSQHTTAGPKRWSGEFRFRVIVAPVAAMMILLVGLVGLMSVIGGRRV
jgi:hypothetical protein